MQALQNSGKTVWRSGVILEIIFIIVFLQIKQMTKRITA